MVDRYSDDDIQDYGKVGYIFPAAEDNVSSTVPTSVEFDPTKNASLGVQSELELARKEIADLKKRLSDFTASHASVASF